MTPTLAYWDIRGLAAPIRYLLEYVGVKYEDKHYKCGGPPNFERPEWLADKASMDIDFPNLPYYIDEDVKLVQSDVILRHLARKHKLTGKNETDQSRVEMLHSQVRDYHMEFVKIVYNPQFNELKEEYKRNLPLKMEALTKFLGQHKFVAGDYLTYADFVLFEYLELQVYFEPTILDNFPKLKEFHKRILELEAIDNYFKFPRAIKYPFNGAPAFFGGAFSQQLNV